MKIGLLADIHGNQPALEAVLNDSCQVDVWFCMGDVVGYYPDVNEVCASLLKIHAQVIRGNHDAYVVGELLPDSQRKVLYRTDWTREHLRPEYLRWLASLPVEINFSFGPKHIRVRHASPWDEETYLYPDSPHVGRIQLMHDEYYLFGHTHHQMTIMVEEGWAINPGSVGQPRDHMPGACYAIFDVESGSVDHHRVRYDVAAYQRRLAELDWPEPTTSILSRSR